MHVSLHPRAGVSSFQQANSTNGLMLKSTVVASLEYALYDRARETGSGNTSNVHVLTTKVNIQDPEDHIIRMKKMKYWCQ
jgi:hypothetical protein